MDAGVGRRLKPGEVQACIGADDCCSGGGRERGVEACCCCSAVGKTLTKRKFYGRMRTYVVNETDPDEDNVGDAAEARAKNGARRRICDFIIMRKLSDTLNKLYILRRTNGVEYDDV